ncbi:hypothetical protein [Kineococcus indalonis]|uniref:hypothetical protein n=1 Tax=Kineococcus indalonis TaxID=2696566 RepID=UPI00141255CE|nr:hypothetical protein [Kineococcus indalonis]NAZ85133.1 hypothetical protein [Kineococcus indalonis]
MTAPRRAPSQRLALVPLLVPLGVALVLLTTGDGPLRTVLLLAVALLGGLLAGLALRTQVRRTRAAQEDRETLDALEPLGPAGERETR